MPSLQMMAKLLNNQTMEALKNPLEAPKRYLECATQALSPKAKTVLGQAAANPKFEDFSFPASPQGSRSPLKRSLPAKPQTVATVEAARKSALAGDAFCLGGGASPAGAAGQGREGAPPRISALARAAGSPTQPEEEQKREAERKEEPEAVHKRAWEAYKLRTQRIAERGLRPSADRAGADRAAAKPAESEQRRCEQLRGGGPHPALLGQEARGEPRRAAASAKSEEEARGEPRRAAASAKSEEDAANAHLLAHEAYMARVQRITNRRVPARSAARPQDQAGRGAGEAGTEAPALTRLSWTGRGEPPGR